MFLFKWNFNNAWSFGGETGWGGGRRAGRRGRNNSLDFSSRALWSLSEQSLEIKGSNWRRSYFFGVNEAYLAGLQVGQLLVSGAFAGRTCWSKQGQVRKARGGRNINMVYTVAQSANRGEYKGGCYFSLETKLNDEQIFCELFCLPVCPRRLISKVDPLSEEYTSGSILIAHTHTHTSLCILTIDVSHRENTTNGSSVFSMWRAGSTKATIWGRFDICPPHIALKQEQHWSSVAEQLLLSFKLLLCSSGVTHMLLKRALWWYCTMRACAPACTLSRFIDAISQEKLTICYVTHVSARSINRSALLNSTSLRLYSWTHLHTQHLQAALEATSVKCVGGEVSRMHVGIALCQQDTGTDGQTLFCWVMWVIDPG